MWRRRRRRRTIARSISRPRNSRRPKSRSGWTQPPRKWSQRRRGSAIAGGARAGASGAVARRREIFQSGGGDAAGAIFVDAHMPPASAPSEQPLTLTLHIAQPKTVSAVRLHYRPTDPAAVTQVLEVAAKPEVSFTIPASDITGNWDLQYFFEIPARRRQRLVRAGSADGNALLGGARHRAARRAELRAA